MITTEPYIVEIALQQARMCAPITHLQGLQLANSLIAGMSTAAKVNVWKKKYCIAYTRNGEKGMLGNGYWHGFMRRHGHKIKAKRGVKFNDK